MTVKKEKSARGYTFVANVSAHPASNVGVENAVRDPEGLHAVFYTDGGCRPSSRGTAGWGLHGYFYRDVDAKQGTGGGVVPTPTGYASDQSGKPLITVEQYVDGYGAIPDSTNNFAEVTALRRAFEIALEKEVRSLTIRADSMYTLDGHGSWMYGWAKAGWASKEGGEVKNAEAWKQVYALQEQLTEKGVAIITQHVSAHNGETGNELADQAATCGVISGFNNTLSEVLVYSDAKGYWNAPKEYNRLLSHPFWYFTTQDGGFHRTVDGRYIYLTGRHSRAEMETIGKAVADTGMSIALLREPDPVLESVRGAADRLRAGRYQGLMIGDLANTLKNKIYQDVLKHGERLMLLNDSHRQITMGYDDSLLGQEIWPPALSFRWTQDAQALFNVLELFTQNDNKSIAITEITPLLYERVKVGKKPETTRLLPSIKSGTRTLDVTGNYLKADGTLGQVKLSLNLSQDIPDRNTLSALADDSTRVHLVTWAQSETAIRFATVIAIHEDISIWCGPYSNMKLIPTKPS